MRKTELRGRFLRLCCLFLLFGFAAVAQRETGQITGTIRDESGAVIAAAKVTVKSITTGVTREATTNDVGLYVVPSLRADIYDVTISAGGFEKYTQRVEVIVGSMNEVSTQLRVAGSTTSVEVAAVAVAVNTESQTLSHAVSTTELNELPTSPTRNPYALVATAGNVTSDTNSGRGVGYTINGQRSSSTSILLDGAENVDAFTASLGQTVPLDSVQEFTVLTNNFSAEYGRAAGGVVNVATKSGTNDYHGTGYEFNRVSKLASNTFNNNANDIPRSVFTRNNFGFSAGGPIRKNKAFFFTNAEWIRVRSSSAIDYTIVDPSSYSLLAPASQNFFKTYGKLAPDAHTLKTLSCGSLTCDVVSYSVPADAGGGMPQNTWMEVARVDYNITEKTSFFARYAAYHEKDMNGTVNNSPYLGYSTGQKSFDQNWTVGATQVFTPSLVDSVKVVYNRLNGPVQPLGSAPVGPTLYTTSSIPTVGGYPLVFPGYSETTPGNSIPFGGPQNLYQVYNDLSWTKGKHQFKFGGQAIQIRDNRVFGAYENAVEYLGTNLSSGLANLVSGNIYQFQGAIYPQGKYPCPLNAQGVAQVSAACTVNLPIGEPSFERNYRYDDFAFYGQDFFKVSSRLTVNAGARWEYYGPQHNADRSLDSNLVMGPGNTIFDKIRNGSVQLAKDGGVFWKPRYTNFGPRAGFAYDVFGDGSTSLRGGFGISYDRNFGNVTFNAIQNPPNYAVVSLTAGSDVASMPVYTDNAGPMAGTGSKALPLVSQRAIDQYMKPAYAETWSLALERRVTPNAVFQVSYSGSHGIHLYDIANINLSGTGADYLGDARGANRLNYQYSNMNYRGSQGYSRYHSLNLKYQASNLFNKGLTATVNYTWAHSLDNLSSTFSESYGGQSGLYQLGYLDAFNPQLNFGNSDFDVRHRVVVSENWDSPWFKNDSNRLKRYGLGGWGVGSILNIRGGMPFSVYDCTNFNGSSCPLWVPSQPVKLTGGAHTATGGDFSPNLYNYITLPNQNGVVVNQGDSLGLPICSGLGHVGCRYTNSGLPYPERNQFVGPGNWNLDLNLYKDFQVMEKIKLQVRAEMYNVLNHSNQYITGLNLDTSSLVDNSGKPVPYVQSEKGGIYGYAGQPSDERRHIQFGLKLIF